MPNANRRRDSHGRFKPDTKGRDRAIGLAAIVGLGAAAVGAAVRFGLLDRFFPGHQDHTAPDLALDQPRPGAEDRAPDAFRPDPTAAVPAGDRESLRPPAGVDRGFSEDKRSTELIAAA